MTARSAFFSGAVLCASGVLLGAFGAHGLQDQVSPDRLQTWETAVRYQLVHGLGLFVIGLLLERRTTRLLPMASIFMLAGTIVFAGSLYVLVLTGMDWLGALAPVGGLALISSWLLVLVAIYQERDTLHPEQR